MHCDASMSSDARQHVDKDSVACIKAYNSIATRESDRGSMAAAEGDPGEVPDLAVLAENDAAAGLDDVERIPELAASHQRCARRRRDRPQHRAQLCLLSRREGRQHRHLDSQHPLTLPFSMPERCTLAVEGSSSHRASHAVDCCRMHACQERGSDALSQRTGASVVPC